MCDCLDAGGCVMRKKGFNYRFRCFDLQSPFILKIPRWHCSKHDRGVSFLSESVLSEFKETELVRSWLENFFFRLSFSFDNS